MDVETSSPTKKNISWSALEYPHVWHHVDWYWSVGFVTLLFVILSIYFKNLLFAILIIIGVIALLIHAVRKPRLISFTVSPSGIKIDKERFPYATLHSFWIDVSIEEDRKILLQSKKMLSPYIVIPLSPEVNEDALREFMLLYLPEQEHHEPLPQRIMEYLGF